MTVEPAAKDADRLNAVLTEIGPCTIAVSGGVDSVTLAVVAHRLLGPQAVQVVHAMSPAVPRAATQRVRDFAAREGWRLAVVDAGEFADERYRENPLNRCYFCKSNLYGTLGKMARGRVLSGANMDDLDDFRPGLGAASENNVIHPYIEAGFAKSMVRRLAGDLGFHDLAALPSSPCLSSRIETGLRIDPDALGLVDRIETWLAGRLKARTLRCRLRHSGILIELDQTTFEALSAAEKDGLIAAVQTAFPTVKQHGVSLSPYRRGSAFVGALT